GAALAGPAGAGGRPGGGRLQPSGDVEPLPPAGEAPAALLGRELAAGQGLIVDRRFTMPQSRWSGIVLGVLAGLPGLVAAQETRITVQTARPRQVFQGLGAGAIFY